MKEKQDGLRKLKIHYDYGIWKSKLNQNQQFIYETILAITQKKKKITIHRQIILHCL